jgi:sec-independent protein translocase protein TatC
VATALRGVSHDDQLSLVEHLDELRTRILVSVVAFVVCFAFCFWQNDAILKIVNRPFVKATSGQKAGGALAKTQTYNRLVEKYAKATSAFAKSVAADSGSSDLTKSTAATLAKQGNLLAKNIPPATRQPVTLGVAEPFTSTFKVAAYAALLLSLPIILWQLYAFVLPAFSPREKQVALPLMCMVPFLFIAGVLMAYFIVLPSAIKVLQNFNSDNFDILVQAKDLYKFTILTCIALGALFQYPLGVIGLVQMDVLSVKQLRDNRRYAILVISILAMLLPGTDPITLILSMIPLLVLYEGSIVVAAVLGRRSRKSAESEDEPATLSDDDD